MLTYTPKPIGAFALHIWGNMDTRERVRIRPGASMRELEDALINAAENKTTKLCNYYTHRPNYSLLGKCDFINEYVLGL